MEYTPKIYWSIFWRTFSYGAAAIFGAAEIYDALSKDFALGADLLIAGLIMAAFAGVVAVLHAAGASPAVTPIGKALRQAFQVAAGVLATVVITVPTDLLTLGPVLVPGIIATATAFLVTLFANQGAPPVIIPTPDAPQPVAAPRPLADAVVGIKAAA